MAPVSTIPVWRIAVRPARPEYDAHGHSVLADLHEYGLGSIRCVEATRLFFVRGSLNADDAQRVGAELLADPITETYTYREGTGADDAEGEPAIEIHFKPGVMDPVAASTAEAIRDMRLPVDEVRTARRYRMVGAESADQLAFIARRILANDCIEEIYLSGFGRTDAPSDVFRRAPVRPFERRYIQLRELDEAGLRRLSRDAHLFLSLEEMRTIQTYYREAGRDPTDLELETLAQTWSEHCVHKTLKSAILYRGAPMPSDAKEANDTAAAEYQFDNLLRDTIARATRELIDDGTAEWCLSVFEDNAGIVALDDEYGVAFKVETHNHPSAIEPYGGAATGVGGVIRDVMGCGLGAKPIANTDVFCVGRPEFPMDALPAGVLHPRRILKGIVAGVRDYGNRMGIPTVNGAVCFDPRFLGNPLVFCGCVGLIPRRMIRKAARPGDRIVVIGGRTGRDGIHGATFSSAELTDSHAEEFSHAVQIGNAITEKKVLDAQLQMRDHPDGCLYTAVTDCGAGGLSSAVGEMGAQTGAIVDLEQVPLKYEGLRYDEIWISEAQERMVLAVPADNWPTVERICQAEDVEATVIGRFTDDRRLVVRYRGEVVGEIDMEFLHDGLPKTRRTAEWHPRPRRVAPQARELVATPAEWIAELKRRLSTLNTASKEWIIRQYDHEVQGASVVKPLTGPCAGPSDAAVIRPRLDQELGIAIGCGLCPHVGDVDPYWMAIAAIDEAIRNVVCVGGDPRRTAVLDNFCWGNCEDARVLGGLVRACRACYDAAKAYGVPFISGKDSLNNEFAMSPDDAARLQAHLDAPDDDLTGNRLRIPGTLLISALARIEDVGYCITADVKPPTGDDDGERSLWVVGVPGRPEDGLRLADAARLHRDVYELIRQHAVVAVHDFSDEGLAVAVAEMAIGGQSDVALRMGREAPLNDPFAPWACGYVVQLADRSAVSAIERGRPYVAAEIGVVMRADAQPRLRFVRENAAAEPIADATDAVAVSLDDLREAWRAPLRW